jgi:curved DNA-binding protein CbpA
MRAAKQLYRWLRISEDASEAEIFRMYKKLREKFSVLGSEKNLEEIEAAYKTLCDPTKRKHYDETGEIWKEDVPIPKDQSEVVSFLSGAFSAVAGPYLNSEQELKDIDFLADIKDHLQQEEQTLLSLIRKLHRTLNRISSCRGKYHLPSPGSPNVLDAVIDKQVEHLQGVIQKEEIRLKNIRLSLQELQKYVILVVVRTDKKEN